MRQRNKVLVVVCVVLIVVWTLLGLDNPGLPSPSTPPHTPSLGGEPKEEGITTQGPIPTGQKGAVDVGVVVSEKKPSTIHSVSRPDLEPLAEVVCSHNSNSADNPPLASVTLSEAALKRVNGGELYPKMSGFVCPKNRFLLVNTHTYGRHHNQLQEIMNTIMWAHKLNRTAIMGWFRYDHQWVDPRAFYDFTELHKRYCIIFHDEVSLAFVAAQGGTRDPLSSKCLGQGFADLPLKKMVGKSVAPCRKGSLTIPSHYTTRFGLNTTQAFFTDLVVPATEGLLVLSGQVGFFMRAGLLESAAAYKWLRPSTKVKAALSEQQSRLFASGKVSFGVHSRSREKECFKEQSFDKLDGSPTTSLGSLTSAHWSALEMQCKLTIPHLDAVLTSTCLGKDSSTSMPQTILASDGQNPDFEKALVAGGALKTAPIPGLVGLAVDYFVLTQCVLFTGNQLSSISQNVCVHRLGNGLPCNGVVPEYLMYHSRPLVK